MFFNPFQDGPFRGWMGRKGVKKEPLPKICLTYPAIMKLGSYTLTKEDPKKI